MSFSIRFSVPGKPRGKARPRVVSNHGKVHSFTPDDHGYVPQIQAAALRALGGETRPTEFPVYLSLFIRRRMPMSWSKKMRAELLGTLTCTIPDPVNIAMNYCDALSGYLWKDDRQVHIKFCEARWSDIDVVDCEVTEIELRAVGHEQRSLL